MSKLKVLELFAGIGGFSLGLEKTGGFETVAFCEIDKTCQKVLNKHWPDITVFKDVSKIWQDGRSLRDLEKTCFKNIDVITGGFPCQDISVAGKGEGLDGKRSGLWFEYKRLIQEIKPKYAIIENVANLRSKGLATVLKDLGEIGYDVEWNIISARSIGGIHLRERVFLITHSNNFRLRSTFTSKEEKQKWWTETTSSQRDLLQQARAFEPRVCRSDAGFPSRVDRPRRERIKQLGNSVVPQIAEWIGQRILEYEERVNEISNISR